MPTIANDTLSTRGYQSLLKQAIQELPVLVTYVFTDWRMWIYLFDIMEAAGFGVRSMIVWNKKSPGLGSGWRAQHELVMFASKTKAKFDNHKAYGNVIECSRSGNTFHPTQKPVELLEKLLDNTDWCNGVYDPFGGSGSTLLAAEKFNQTAYKMELTPAFCDTLSNATQGPRENRIRAFATGD
jgi:DNA modification methylase